MCIGVFSTLSIFYKIINVQFSGFLYFVKSISLFSDLMNKGIALLQTLQSIFSHTILIKFSYSSDLLLLLTYSFKHLRQAYLLDPLHLHKLIKGLAKLNTSSQKQYLQVTQS